MRGRTRTSSRRTFRAPVAGSCRRVIDSSFAQPARQSARHSSIGRALTDFHGEPAAVIDAVQEQLLFLLCEVFVDRFSLAVKMSVIVDDQHAAFGDMRVKMVQLANR